MQLLLSAQNWHFLQSLGQSHNFRQIEALGIHKRKVEVKDRKDRRNQKEVPTSKEDEKKQKVKSDLDKLFMQIISYDF